MTAVATLNCGDGPDSAKARALDRLVHHGADVIGLQEAGDRARLLGRWCEASGWHCWLGDKEGSASTPILWDPTAVRVTHQGTTPATDAKDAGPLGVGPNVVKAKVWNHVRVRPHNDDIDPFVFINGHLPASLWAPRRRALGHDQIAVLVDMVERREDRIDVVAVGDFNCRDNSRVVKPLHRLGMHQHTHAPTHGRRTIDLTWTLGVGGRAEVVTVPSDHRAVVLTLR